VILRSITTLLQRLGGETDAIHIKVPNDIMIHGKKVAGVLVETSHPYAVIGIGINTIAAPIPISTSLLDALGIHVNNADMAAQLHTIIIAELT
jgi:biotin-(acetyl-CoA carboxylase) ligase